MKTALIIYHRIDFDGLCSLSVICDWCESHGIQFKKLGYSYGDDIPQFNDNYDMVFVVDVTLPHETMRDLNRHGKLIWIDHHVTNINDSEKEGYSDAPGIRRNGVGACELCWQYCFKKHPLPHFIELLSAYDVWDKKRFDWENETLPFQMGLRNHIELAPDRFMAYYYYSIYGSEGGKTEQRILEQGRTIISYSRSIGKKACDTYGFVVEIDGGRIRGLCLLTPHFGALEMEESIKEKGCQVGICVNYIADKNIYKVSVYAGSANIDGFNIGQYMKEKYNGGGHSCAAGGTLSQKQFNTLLTKHTL